MMSHNMLKKKKNNRKKEENFLEKRVQFDVLLQQKKELVCLEPIAPAQIAQRKGCTWIL